MLFAILAINFLAVIYFDYVIDYIMIFLWSSWSKHIVYFSQKKKKKNDEDKNAYSCT